MRDSISDSFSVSLRRLRKEDVDEVVEIEKEAFSPLWVSSAFRRDVNNKYACYLVASLDHGAKQPEVIQPEAGGDGEASDTWEQPASEPSSFWSRLASKFLQQRPAGPPTPAVLDYAIAGYVSVWYQGEEAHITEIAVREGLRGNGIGELLLIGSLREAVKHGSAVMTLEARVSNFIAQRLYEKYSFKSVGIRKGYYSDNREDAVIMTTSPIKTEEYGRMFQERQDAYETRWGAIAIQE